MAAGLVYGNAVMGNPFRIVIVSVEDDKENLKKHIADTVREVEAITRCV